jgi:CRISPR-associated protein Cmr2
MSESYLLLIALGPVQDFIMTARRTRDLWFGSYLLSECSKATAKALKDAGAELIFPNPNDPDTDLIPNKPDGLNVCNIILAQYECADENTALNLANKAKQAAKDNLLEMFDKSLRDIWKVPKIDSKNARVQVKDMLEVYCAVTEIKDNDYCTARDRVNVAIASRKATRDFVQPTWSKAGVPKSSLDGARESITPDNEQHLERLGLRRGERLCGVGLLKRLGIRGLEELDKKRFASTSSIAAAQIFTPENQAVMLKYFNAINELRFDEDRDQTKNLIDITGAALFESRLEEMLDTRSNTEDTKLTESERKYLDKQVAKAKVKLKELLDKVSNGKQPLPYFVLLLADGDNMGVVLDNQKTKLAHQEFSKDLAGFAITARETVESNEHQGCLIYAGGDDVLALLPLHTALKCVKQLSDDFNNAVGKYKTVQNEKTICPSLSAGMVVWHHLESLSEALEAARKAERIAKKVPDKNALCITISKRSGAELTVKDRLPDLVDHLTEFSEALVAKAIPEGAAYQLRDIARTLTHLPAAQLEESVRILERKQGNAEIIGKLVHRLTDNVTQRSSRKLSEIVDELLASRIFADAQELRGIVKNSDEQHNRGNK